MKDHISHYDNDSEQNPCRSKNGLLAALSLAVAAMTVFSIMVGCSASVENSNSSSQHDSDIGVTNVSSSVESVTNTDSEQYDSASDISSNVESISSDTDDNSRNEINCKNASSGKTETDSKKTAGSKSETNSKKATSSKSETNSKKAASSKSETSSKKAASSKSQTVSSKNASSTAQSINSTVNSTAAQTTIITYDNTPTEFVNEQTYYDPAQVDEEPVYYEPEPISETAPVKYEEFDEYGRLIIDTDTLDGKKAIAITFDDGPSIYTEDLIAGLNARGARATFFMVGSNVERFSYIIPQMLAGGHQIGNHTYSHINMPSYGEYTWRSEIAMTDNALINSCGQESTAFRPPYGAYSYYMASSIPKTFTLWNVDTLDWQSRNKAMVINHILSDSSDGSIVLLHDVYRTSIDAALDAIDIMQEQGYVFVTVDELLTRYGYPIKNNAHFSQYPVLQTHLIPKPEPEPQSDTDSEIGLSTDSDISTDTYIISDTDSEIEKTDTDLTAPDSDIQPDNDRNPEQENDSLENNPAGTEE